MKGPGWCGAEAATSRIPPLRALPASQLLPSPARCRPVGLTGSRAGRNFSSLAAGGAGQGPALSRPVSHRPACTTCSILPRMSGRKNNKPTKKQTKPWSCALASTAQLAPGQGWGSQTGRSLGEPVISGGRRGVLCGINIHGAAPGGPTPNPRAAGAPHEAAVPTAEPQPWRLHQDPSLGWWHTSTPGGAPSLNPSPGSAS